MGDIILNFLKSLLGLVDEVNNQPVKLPEIAPALPETLAKIPDAPKELVKFENSGQMRDWYPKAVRHVRRMRTKGTYAKKYPRGLCVHFTAGRDGAAKTIDGGIKNGFTFLCIQKDGTIVQAHPISEWGYHAGESAWKNAVLKPLVGSVSDDLIGVEINNSGRLTEKDGKLFTWFGVEVPRENARYTPGRDNQVKGWYEKYTPAQEKTLIELILWLKNEAPDIFDLDLVLGHDEVAGPKQIGRARKNDPGAALSCTMPEFRKILHQKYKESK